jgi:hypothetical protein
LSVGDAERGKQRALGTGKEGRFDFDNSAKMNLEPTFRPRKEAFSEVRVTLQKISFIS